MKSLILLISFLSMALIGNAQSLDRDTYTVSGGLLGALNYNKIRVSGDNVANAAFEPKAGWSLGGWVNFPIGQVFSVEPQLTYTFIDVQAIDGSDLLPYGGLSYLALPVLFKLDATRYLSLTVGPEFDFLLDLNNTRDGVEKENLGDTNLGLSLGFELLPHEVITIFGRYVHGFTDLDVNDLDDDAEFTHSNFQAGIKVRLFGEVIPADTDDDGIADVDDLCPTVAGLASMSGCPDTDNDGVTDAADDCPLVAGIPRLNGCPIPDTDGDGVNDEVDQCVSVAGVAKYNGCPIPDTDGDGINDENDKCVNVAGIAKYNGCPIPDTDGDGVNDENDKCPTVAGLAAYDGCPNPDRDNDGVADADDRCPDVPGPATNAGCPVIESATFNSRMINFESGSATLTAQSKRDLVQGANLLNSPGFLKLKVHIDGHTDSVGSKTSNHSLSHRRAESVRNELIKNGVDPHRLIAAGYGEDRPIADNSTAEGRAQNRRVELTAHQ